MLFLYFLDFYQYRIKRHVKGFLKGFGALLDKNLVLGNLHTYLCNLVFYLVDDIIKLEKNINAHDPVVVAPDLGNFPVRVVKQFAVGIKMYRLDVNGHFSGFLL
jgi:hypothetical protein